MNYLSTSDWLNALDMKGFPTPILLAVSRNITRLSGHTISFTCLSEPPVFLKSPPLLMASING